VVHLAEASPNAYEAVTALAEITYELPPFRDASEHLHIAARKPNRSRS